MTPTSQQPIEHDPNGSDLLGTSPVDTDASSTQTVTLSFGGRLRAAREARGLDVEICAHTLKLPSRVLRQLEHDEYADIDSKIYLGSYIGKYAQYLGINEDTIQVEVDRIKHVEPALVATGGISHSRFLLDRYATAATYAVLTAVIVVPMIWLGVRGTLDRDLSHLAPLDAAPVAQQDAPASNASVDVAQLGTGKMPAAPAPQIAVPKPPASEQPLLASMAPFPNLDTAAVQAPSVTPAAVIDTGTGSHSLALSLRSASWVEVTDRDGKRLEYGLLPAGSSKTYHSDQPLEVRIGNSGGAQVSIDGQSVGLDDFRHSNVAHFRVQMQDGKAAAANF